MLPQYYFLAAALLTSCYIGVSNSELLVVSERNDLQNSTLADVCYPDIGCFGIEGKWFHPIHRPINFFPFSPDLIQPNFLLHTRSNLKDAYVMRYKDEDKIKASPFNPKLPTIFLVHGFIDMQLIAKWMRDMKDEFLVKQESNVFIVDWAKGNLPPYTQATANTRVIGALIAVFINNLERIKGADMETMHILGHSLGSHVAGYAGERLKRLGRITGLDPAGPYYEFMPPEVRLDPTDAIFVDAIHTDAKHLIPSFGFGMMEPCGHVDFYPNGGIEQPGCNQERVSKIISDGIAEGLRRFVLCNHQRAVDFFQASINHKACLPKAYHCSDFDTFKHGRCSDCGEKGELCAFMGLDAIKNKPFKDDKVSQKVYLQTGSAFPFCTFQYQVKVKLGKPSGFKDQKGKLTLTFHGTKGIETKQLSQTDENFYHGSTYNYIALIDHNIGDIEKVDFKWHSSFGLGKHELNVAKITLTQMFDTGKSSQETETSSFCSTSKESIKADTSSTFNVKC